MIEKKRAEQGLQALQSKGADKAQVGITESSKHELSVENGNFSLLRTTYNHEFSFQAITENKKGDYSANKLDKETIDEASDTTMSIARASGPDPAYDIAPHQPSGKFESGPERPDMDMMYNRLKTYVTTVSKEYPAIILESAVVEFTGSHSYFLNTNGVDFFTRKGYYTFSTIFTSKEGKKSSSFNYSYFLTKNMDKEFIECGSVRTLLDQSVQQTTMKTLDSKFDGEIIITPDCLGSFINSFTDTYLSDYHLITGTSILKDSLNKQVAAPQLTLRSKPLSEEFAENSFVTYDGFKMENSTIIDKGILKTFLLSLYGAHKTGKPRAVNNGNYYVIEPGNTAKADMIKSVKKGLLVCRTSGGRPNDKGDFSTVAKNSYYIEDGEIKYPVHETMITGNIADMFMNIKAISKERINFGYEILPWVLVDKLTISGK